MGHPGYTVCLDSALAACHEYKVHDDSADRIFATHRLIGYSTAVEMSAKTVRISEKNS